MTLEKKTSKNETRVLSDPSFFFLNYLVGKPNTTCSHCVIEKSVNGNMRAREIIENINREA